MVQEHNRQSAGMWGDGGRAYDYISFGISDALAHAAQRLWPTPGEKILDVATGTGWSARNAALGGALVTAVDIADDLLAAARSLSAHVEPAIDFRHGDAEALPFDDARFDGVISTFGVMFAPNQETAAAELARVCRPGGRLVLATWDPDPEEYVPRLFSLGGKYSDAPPPNPSPLAWGRPERVEALLGHHFTLHTETRVTTFFAPNGESIWEKFLAGFGPIKRTVAALDAAQGEALRDDFIAFNEEFRAESGLCIDRRYLLTYGVRR
jgi:SAM-dependent methyltransferase